MEKTFPLPKSVTVFLPLCAFFHFQVTKAKKKKKKAFYCLRIYHSLDGALAFHEENKHLLCTVRIPFGLQVLRALGDR